MSIKLKLSTTDIISIIGVVVALIFSTINLFDNSKQRKDINQINYRLNSLDYQPRLKVISIPEWSNLEYSAKLDYKNVEPPPPGDSVATFMTTPKVTINTKLKIVNVGTAKAELLAVVHNDTTVAYDILRDKIYKNIKIKTSSFSEFLTDEVLPNAIDTVDIEFNHRIRFFEDNKFVIHYLILYKNELGQVFDTYYWCQGQFKDFIFPAPIRRLDENRIIVTRQYHTKVAKKDMLDFEDAKSSYKIYTENECKRIQKFIDNIIN